MARYLKLIRIIMFFRLCAYFLDDMQFGWEVGNSEIRIRVHGKVLNEKICPSYCCFPVVIIVRMFFDN